jgi:hypothetical protein
MICTTLHTKTKACDASTAHVSKVCFFSATKIPGRKKIITQGTHWVKPNLRLLDPTRHDQESPVGTKMNQSDSQCCDECFNATNSERGAFTVSHHFLCIFVFWRDSSAKLRDNVTKKHIRESSDMLV